MKANPNFLHLKSRVPKDRVCLLQGGTRSAKTFSTIYFLIWLCQQHRGMEIDIVRETFTALNATAWKDFRTTLMKHQLYDEKKHNKSEKWIELNGNIISYYGADNPEKIHGRARDILWVNEAQHFKEETIDQLFPRTRQRIICDYNPALPTKHWLDKYIKEFPPCITTYRDNQYLTKAQIADIESRKDNKYWWQVYGTGERSRPEGTIFNNFKRGKFDDSLPYIHGMDHGFRNPFALIKIAVDENRKIIYMKQKHYERELSTDEIISILRTKVDLNDLIVADSADPRMNEELRYKGFNIEDAKKGPDSVLSRIRKMQGYQIVYEESPDLEMELQNYKWHSKKAEVPIKEFDHLLDAAGYAFMSYETPNVDFF